MACLGTSETRDNEDAALAKFSSRPKCIVTMAGPTDLTDLSAKVEDRQWTYRQVGLLLGGPTVLLAEKARKASPIFQVDARSVPALIIQGRTDHVVPVEQAERFAAALTKAGVENRLVLLNGDHDMNGEGDGEKFGTELFRFLGRFLPP